MRLLVIDGSDILLRLFSIIEVFRLCLDVTGKIWQDNNNDNFNLDVTVINVLPAIINVTWNYNPQENAFLSNSTSIFS